jgi:hypothetical protein
MLKEAWNYVSRENKSLGATALSVQFMDTGRERPHCLPTSHEMKAYCGGDKDK